MELLLSIFKESWHLLQASSVYILFGILIAGLMKVFISPEKVATHLGSGKVQSVFKAAALGIPLPLCSCGVLPAAASLKRQGANNGATMSFLISTPESSIDSIVLTYALIDPIITVARPLVGFVTAFVAGITENVRNGEDEKTSPTPDLSCTIDGCCDGIDCPPEAHANHHSFPERLGSGLGYAFGTLWADIAVWFLVGILLAGVISALVPQELMTRYLGGGLPAMLIMLAAGIPLYICATASTPIAAALIIQGVSPGAALVFLLTGPATNITSLTVLLRILGKRATVLYLAAIAVFAVAAGLLLDQIYGAFNLSAQAMAGHGAHFMPPWAKLAGAWVVLSLSVKPVYQSIRSRFGGSKKSTCADETCSCGSNDKGTVPIRLESTSCGSDHTCNCEDK